MLKLIYTSLYNEMRNLEDSASREENVRLLGEANEAHRELHRVKSIIRAWSPPSRENLIIRSVHL